MIDKNASAAKLQVIIQLYLFDFLKITIVHDFVEGNILGAFQKFPAKKDEAKMNWVLVRLGNHTVFDMVP